MNIFHLVILIESYKLWSINVLTAGKCGGFTFDKSMQLNGMMNSEPVNANNISYINLIYLLIVFSDRH